MDLFDTLQTPIIFWTLLVLWVGYMIGSFRGRRKNDKDLIGPPPIRGGDRQKSAGTPPQKLDHTIAQWAELDPKTEAAINDAMLRDRKIEAIKILRDATNMDLRDAKDAVESRMRS